MTILDEILRAPEGKTLEFKRDLSSPKPLIKTLVAFANTAGGKLVIGIDDDKKVVGVDQPLDEEERLSSLIADSISPRLVPNIELVTVDGKTLLVVEVYLSGSRPHWVNAKGSEQGVYVRLGSTNRLADLELIAELRRSVEGIAFDEMPMPQLTIDDLDLPAAQALFGDARKLDEQTLITLKLLTRHQGRLVPTKGAVLLFGRQRTFHFADAWIQCGRFLGVEKIDIFDHIDIDTSLPTAVDEVMLFLKKHAYRGADLSEVRRKDVWSIPLSILREVVINSIVHADYSQRGAPIRVVFLDDRIEIENPGILLPGLTIEDIKQGTSKIRNTVIARVFRELNLIEQWGTGVRRIFREAEAQGLPEPQIAEIGMRLRFIVPLREPITTEKQPAEQVTQQVTQQVAQQVRRLLGGLKGEMSRSELMHSVNLKDRVSFSKNYLEPAFSDGLIEMTQPDSPRSPTQKYRLTEKGRQIVLDKDQ
jgi:predicted HTH transcriptional regulator